MQTDATRVYFAVPTHYTIGAEYETFEQAVAAARETILPIGGCEGRFTRAFVDVRVADPTGDRSLHRVEIFRDETVELPAYDGELRLIHPTTQAPYRLRVLTADFPAEGAIAVEWKYRFSCNDYTAAVKRVDGDRIERYVRHDEIAMPSPFDPTAAVERARELVAEARS